MARQSKSLFDFLNKGLLGSSNEFQHFVNGLEGNPEGYQKLKAMVSPFILRRLKTDKTIISDLPDKVEQVDYVELSKKQVALYRKEVKQLEGDQLQLQLPRLGADVQARRRRHVCHGVRLDENPFYFFSMRGLDVDRFIDVTLKNRVEQMLANAGTLSSRVITGDDVAMRVFGL